ncbi:hypothetical protein SAMN05661012_06480 [Chitinophaga sancti]|uniref:Uncharacterized protein n=1 Tax=Chitinophaga sancti TaxID=1004 RepID=A0A1K1SZE5_9BACT|nr:hypothetical protein SAMN05661012_06480 [Chitinophaga sancti]
MGYSKNSTSRAHLEQANDIRQQAYLGELPPNAKPVNGELICLTNENRRIYWN